MTRKEKRKSKGPQNFEHTKMGINGDRGRGERKFTITTIPK